MDFKIVNKKIAIGESIICPIPIIQVINAI